MTIAVCYLSPEGLVLGADSATGYEDNKYFMHSAQKVYEVGRGSTIGLVTWGTSGVSTVSFRKLIADFADELKKAGGTPTGSKGIKTVAQRWANQFSSEFKAANKKEISRCAELKGKTPYDKKAPASPTMRTKDEEDEFNKLNHNGTGFCLGGHVIADRIPAEIRCERASMHACLGNSVASSRARSTRCCRARKTSRWRADRL
jgi:hypothetical protein